MLAAVTVIALARFHNKLTILMMQQSPTKPLPPLIEFVPNFSVGRNQRVIDAIVGAVRSVDKLVFLHRDSSETANRTVLTAAGSPEAVEEAGFKAIEVAIRHIDMRTQQGTHPRIGAADVVPFVPLQDRLHATAVQLARRLARTVGERLHLPVFLYGDASPTCRELADIRRGEFEGLAHKLSDPRWQPDAGPAVPHPTAGATAIGVRPLLIAFNINLETADVKVARSVAALIREKGPPMVKHLPGRLRAVRAIGWKSDEFGVVQVSTNLIDFQKTPPHVVFEAVKILASDAGVAVNGSELVGLMPREALQMAGRFYAPMIADENERMLIAAQKLGLSAVKPFSLKEHLLEERLWAALD